MRIHVKVLAALFFALGVVLAIGALFSSALFGFLATTAGSADDEGAALGTTILGLTGVTLAVVVLLFSIPSLFCGWGLLRHRRWARILGIVLASILLVQIPIGTAFGVYALWVLLSARTETLFDTPGA